MIDDSAMQRMNLAAFEAAGDGSRWAALLEDMRTSFGATSVCLRVPASDGECSAGWWEDAGVDPGQKKSYLTQWGARDPWASHPSGHRISKVGRCFIGSAILPWKDLERSTFYNEFGRGEGFKGVMTALVEDGKHVSGAPEIKLALFRANGLPEFEPALLHRFEALQPALRRALHGYWALRNIRLSSSAVQEAFDAMPSPVLVLRRDRTVDHMNAKAAVWERDGRIKSPTSLLTQLAHLGSVDLDELIGAAERGINQEVALWFMDGARLETAILHISRIVRTSTMRACWPRSDVLLVIQRQDATRVKKARIQGMASHYRLTAAEVKILALLADGAPVEQIAVKAGIRITTARTHMRHLLDKTGCTRIYDLLRMVLE